ncbi:hypothetical protein CDAR_540801 [Caerostris darwini]|uniref:Uncharacterized protein n=1 Tax=Caerostris darwini TaxID=1538125 RepID=A0AAV4NC54_9ARAC|nr:hypothetical protein CDAR_540801 [Caerostris darwini]
MTTAARRRHQQPHLHLHSTPPLQVRKVMRSQLPEPTRQRGSDFKDHRFIFKVEKYHDDYSQTIQLHKPAPATSSSFAFHPTFPSSKSDVLPTPRTNTLKRIRLQRNFKKKTYAPLRTAFAFAIIDCFHR